MRHPSTPHSANGLLLLILPICMVALQGIDYLRVEALLLGCALLGAWWARRQLHWTPRPPGWCAPLRRWSRNPALACGLPAAASLALRLALLPWIPVPHPVVPDEYSHIFLAKTLLLGRLANPPHPLWPHFESIHILSQPTFSSMYMAGQAVFLALGKLLTGSFFAGVLLSTALFCAALTWFLRAYVPPGWALYGGLLAAVRFGAASYWNNSYWGGSVGALGGALALGAYARLARAWRPWPAVSFAAGLVLLANTRPYEGAGLGGALVTALAWDFFRNRSPVRLRLFAGSVAAAVAVLAISGWAMTRHWKAVTGDSFTLPYQVNQRMYGWPMTLPWLAVRPVEYRHPEFALYRDYEVQEHKYVSVPAEMPFGLAGKISYVWRFFLGVSLSAVLVFTGRVLSARRTRAIWIVSGVAGLLAMTEQTGSPHYFSPLAGPIVLFTTQGLRYLAQWSWRGAPLGPAIVRAIVPILCIIVGVRAAALSPHSPPSPIPNYASWCCADARQRDREPLLRRLEATPGKHLVIVHYDLASYDTFEWVYNEPDIDGAKVVWARDMGDQKNRELLSYYPERRVWTVLVKDQQGVLLGESMVTSSPLNAP
ncbi:MAG TPA: hypothetical protein VGR73_20615 [Bryobacteraceae bacterium]|nr:hypothetical protein [Bryobacteraceae bacterium]